MQDISFSDSDIDNYNLEVSFDDDTNLQSILSTGLKVKNSLATMSVNEENSITENQSKIINCKTICNYLIKPIANKIFIKILKKKPSAKKIDTKKMQMNESKSIDEKIYKLKLVRTNIHPDGKSTNNYFTTCGDIVYYNI